MQSSIRKETGCTVIAIRALDQININPNPDTILQINSEIILIGTVDSENKFFEIYGK